MHNPKKRGGMGISAKHAVAVVAAILVIYIIYSLLQPGVVNITTAKTLSLARNQTQFIKIYNGGTIAIRLASTTNLSASFYITRVPILYSSVAFVSLPIGGGANVSSNGTRTADMNIGLVSTGGQGATITVAPLLSSFGIGASSSVHLINPVAFGAGGSINVTFVTSTTSTTVTTSASTTVNSTANLFQQALSLANSTGIGTLMAKYKALYKNSVNCTPSLYNSTYNTYKHTLPPAPLSFANVSPYTPTNINITESGTGGKNVQVVYSTIARIPSTPQPAIQILVNVTASLVTQINYLGIYKGLNYAVLNSSYSFQSRILNSCAALISP